MYRSIAETEWNPYPEYVPIREGKWVVTLITPSGNRIVSMEQYRDFEFVCESKGFKVVAFGKMPKVYEGE